MPFKILENEGGRWLPLSVMGRPLVFGTRRRAQMIGAYECSGRWKVVGVGKANKR